MRYLPCFYRAKAGLKKAMQQKSICINLGMLFRYERIELINRMRGGLVQIKLLGGLPTGKWKRQ